MFTINNVKVYNTNDIAEELKISKRNVFYLYESEKIKSYYFGHRYFTTEKDLQAYKKKIEETNEEKEYLNRTQKCVKINKKGALKWKQ